MFNIEKHYIMRQIKWSYHKKVQEEVDAPIGPSHTSVPCCLGGFLAWSYIHTLVLVQIGSIPAFREGSLLTFLWGWGKGRWKRLFLLLFFKVNFEESGKSGTGSSFRELESCQNSALKPESTFVFCLFVFKGWIR